MALDHERKFGRVGDVGAIDPPAGLAVGTMGCAFIKSLRGFLRNSGPRVFILTPVDRLLVIYHKGLP